MRRREINIIHRIKDKNGRWIEDNEEVMKNFKDSFEDLFKGSDGEEEDLALQYTPTLITLQENSLLLKDI